MSDLIKLVDITSKLKRNKFVKTPYPDVNYTILTKLTIIIEGLNMIQNEIKQIISLKNEQIATGEID